MINHNKALKGKQREQPLSHYSGACEIASQTKVEVLSQGDYSDGQAVQSTPALATVEAKDDLQDYHQQSKTSSRHHSRRISASNSLDVLHNRQSQSGASNQQSEQLQTVVQQTQVQQFRELEDILNESMTKTIDHQSKNEKKPEMETNAPNEVTKIETFMNESVDYTDQSCNWLPTQNLLNRRNSRYRRKFDVTPSQLVITSQREAGGAEFALPVRSETETDGTFR